MSSGRSGEIFRRFLSIRYSAREETDRVTTKIVNNSNWKVRNIQCNIIPRAFVEDVLVYPKSSIRELRDAERVECPGVTGQRLVPEGVVSQEKHKAFHN